MTKKTTLKWRLANRPTPKEVSELFMMGLITKEEAREILFSSETQEDRDKQSLEAEIKFLREIVERLSNSRTHTIEIIKEVEKPYMKYDWHNPYAYWCSSTTDNNTLTATAGGTYTLSSNSLNDVVTAGYVSASGTNGFSDIKTF